MEIDAVQIIAGLLGRDGEARLLDQALQVRRRQREAVAEIVDAERREIVRGQRLERELRRAGGDGKPSLLAVAVELDIGSFGQLAHDVVEHMRRYRGGAFALGLARHRLDQLHVEIGGGQLQLVLGRADQDVGQDGDGIAPLDHARDMGERACQAWFVDGEAHGDKIPRKCRFPAGALDPDRSAWLRSKCL